MAAGRSKVVIYAAIAGNLAIAVTRFGASLATPRLTIGRHGGGVDDEWQDRSDRERRRLVRVRSVTE